MSKNRTWTGEVIRVSKGQGDENYTLRVVIYVSPRGEFPEVDELEDGEELEIALGNRPAFISQSEHFYLIRVPDFSSGEEADDFLRRIRAGLMAFTLKQRTSVRAVEPLDIDKREETKLFREQDRPEMYGDWTPREDGTITDGAIFPHFTAVIPEHLRIVEYPPPIYVQRKGRIQESKHLSEAFDEINASYDTEGILNNERLTSALEIFTSAYAQEYRPLTYLNLVIVLEILAGNETPASELVIGIVERFISFIKRLRTLFKIADREKYEQLNDLLNGLSRLKKLSIGGELRRYVYEAVHKGDPNITEEESHALVSLIYGVRSNLAHTGSVSHRKDAFPQQTYSDTIGPLERIVPQALMYELNKYLKPGARPLSLSYLPQ